MLCSVAAAVGCNRGPHPPAPSMQPGRSVLGSHLRQCRHQQSTWLPYSAPPGSRVLYRCEALPNPSSGPSEGQGSSSGGGNGGGGDENDGSGGDLASQFGRLLTERGLDGALQRLTRGPSHLLSPSAAIAAQMDALQMLDWPEAGAGLDTAYAFAKPRDAEHMLAGGAAAAVRSWHAAERWVSRAEFAEELRGVPYRPLLACESWRPASGVVFPSQRHPNKAVQAISIVGSGSSSSNASGSSSSSSSDGGSTHHTFTFCVERVDAGAFKGCWMTVGVRSGDYAVE